MAGMSGHDVLIDGPGCQRRPFRAVARHALAIIRSPRIQSATAMVARRFGLTGGTHMIRLIALALAVVVALSFAVSGWAQAPQPATSPGQPTASSAPAGQGARDQERAARKEERKAARQQKKADCRGQAEQQMLRGDARKEFIKRCRAT
jgi:hypothetical protein